MDKIVQFIRETFATEEFIALHEPRFIGREKEYLNDCIDTAFVSSVGKYVDRFEQDFARLVGANYAVATVNGTAALHIALLLSGVERDNEVITQPLTFVATCNAIAYTGAKPIFVDVDLDTLGMSPRALTEFLEKHCRREKGKCINQTSGNIVKACVPMHTFGHPCKIREIQEICEQWHLELVEDSAESVGSFYQHQHTGTFGKLAAFSFNGNKTITAGGGGAIVTNDAELAKAAKHITTTAKIPHPYKYVHDMVGYNYRMPNINAALIVAQIEQLDKFLAAKRKLALVYQEFFAQRPEEFVVEPADSRSNYWLQAIKFQNRDERDKFLQYSNDHGVMTRPIWSLMNELRMYKDCQHDELNNAKYLESVIVNLPSSAILQWIK